MDNYENRNTVAWDQLVLNLSSRAFSVIQEANSDAHEAWKPLLDKYNI